MNLAKLGSKLEQLIARLDGRAGIVLRVLETGEEWRYRSDERFSAASIIKLPILWELLNACRDGRLDLNGVVSVTRQHKVGGTGILKELHDGIEVTIRDLATLMIVVSDNTATNMIIDLLGFETINRAIDALGLKGTALQRRMMDFEAKKAGKDNYTTPQDTATVLQQLAGDREAVDILLRQQLNNKLPKGLLVCPNCGRAVGDYPKCPWCYVDLRSNPPTGARLAHKTGELAGVEHDAGILLLEGKTLIIVVMTSDLTSNDEGIRFIASVGSAIAEEALTGDR
ncbi:MAG: serine hydrolase [Bacillota bacterium]